MHTVVSPDECCVLFEMRFLIRHGVISLGNTAVMHRRLGPAVILSAVMNCQCWLPFSYYETFIC